ncbi:MAG: sigma-70 family RNA polymerase sigma factor [Acutalibacteraceae bacterium]|jgi:RNA polymerase sigma-70 factor (ECF subfamily)
MQIVDGIRQGSAKAIEYAINKYSKLIWHIAAAVLTNTAPVEDVEECVADVFVYLWQSYEKFDPERGSLKSWLSLVARSKAVDRFRAVSKSRETELNDNIELYEKSLLDDLIALEGRREIKEAINALTEPDREIIIRRYYFQQKPKEIALALNLTVKQINNRLYTAKLQLRKTLTEIRR